MVGEQISQEPEQNKYMQQIDAEMAAANAEVGTQARNQISMYNGEGEENLIKWQLDLREDKEKIRRLLQGIKEGFDDQGDPCYIKPDDLMEVPFSDYGVTMVMQILDQYLTKNTILSNYDEKTINWKVCDFGNNLIDFFHNAYDKLLRVPSFQEAKQIIIDSRRQKEKDINEIAMEFFGNAPSEQVLNEMTAFQQGFNKVVDEISAVQKTHMKEKWKMVPIIHEAIVNTIHSAYLRAYRGGERESLRTARTVTQNQPMMSPQMGHYQPQVQKKAKWLSPSTWGR